ncbi:MAG: ORF6N domain-containing protein [Bacteroidetes bacterium]|nr:MAG: ORF6N domain-containing protein [Bacteroidota bacterium]
MNLKHNLIPEETILKKILVLREEKVLLDVHLAELYGVETRTLKQAVRRNLDRFPEDFMFVLSDDELELLVSHSVIPSKSFFGGAAPFAFTEAGVAMLSSVLKSKRAIEMNLSIIRTFIALRMMAVNYKDLLQKLQNMEAEYDGKFQEIYQALKYLMEPPKTPRKRIGY